MATTEVGSLGWSRERVEMMAGRVCDPGRIEAALAAGAGAEAPAARDLLHKAAAMGGLSAAETAVLIQVADRDLRKEIKQAARQVHAKVFGRRVHLSAPVCPTNRCVNDCLYCPLRRSNARLRRHAFTARDIQREIRAPLDEGHTHVALVFGDDRSGIQYVRDMVWAAYGTRSGIRQIRRLDLNLDALPVQELRELKEAPIGTYHVFQETYHPDAYAALHPDGPKSDYAWRLSAHDRAHEAGLANVGLGVLLGAYRYAFDVVAVLDHNRHLLETYGHPAAAIAYPRMIAAAEAPASHEASRQISDADLTFIVAVTRLAAPHQDILLCTPAPREVRQELYGLGVSHVSVGSLSYPGVYSSDGNPLAAGGLRIGRPRGLEELVYRMCEGGFVPNFCVACYVQKRRAAVMDHTAPPPEVKDRCSPNALLALKEYLMDFASPETRNVGDRLIQSELARLPERVRSMTLDLMEEAEAGLRGQML